MEETETCLVLIPEVFGYLWYSPDPTVLNCDLNTRTYKNVGIWYIIVVGNSF